MDRKAYNSCLSPYIKGKGKPKEQRRLDFCIGAKMCTSKASNQDEAKKICLAMPPKPPREPRERRAKRGGDSRNCGQKMVDLARCASRKIELTQLTQENFTMALAEALRGCGCHSVPTSEGVE